MLNLARRHSSSKCGKTKKRDCTCPIWVTGSLRGKRMRKALGIRNWESAQRIVRDWEAGNRPAFLPVKDAFARYIEDCEARRLGSETLRKYRLLEREMVAEFGNLPIDSIGINELAEYRKKWKVSVGTDRKKIERLRAFFRFCIGREFIEKNPAIHLIAGKEKPKQSVPFTDEEIAEIMAGIEEFPDSPPGRRKQLRAFVLLLRYSGLRIQDATSFTMDKISDGNLMMPTQKTGQVVWLPLPDIVLESLKGLGERPFWSGSGTIKTFMGNWQRTLDRLFKRAGVKGSAHKFRHTFSVNLLTRGVSIEDVAILLGHNSIRITERHYSAFVKVRRDRLMEAVKRTF